MEKKRGRYLEVFKKETVEYLICRRQADLARGTRAGPARCDGGYGKRQYAGDPTVKTPDSEELSSA